MRLPKDYAAPKQEETTVEFIWEQKGCVQQRREPIVRCRDCKHFAEVRMADGTTSHRCSGVMAFVDNAPDNFCAWGVRKDD